ncbi:MAG TPA: methyltransferase domain-containing protein, partial [Candidatus Saccharimonadales bacterium]|nr:methyltransferase domain-containing protein [Candidatus Saccharimonadales bacterium]
VRELPDRLARLTTGKLKLGISLYGIPVSPQLVFRCGLELKKMCRKQGRSLRFIAATGSALNSAQVLHNQLTSDLGMELCLIKNGAKTWVAQTTAVQDVDDYARRDFGRPRRDAFVGMLPPKLAQVMLNLARPVQGDTILDPFCGTGVLLQEAALQRFAIYGTDINEKMVRYTRDNLHWLQETYAVGFEKYFEIADATKHTWRQPVQHVVCETYLGQPLSGLPSPQKLEEIIQNCNTIIGAFLKNIRPQLPANSRHCIAVPAWYDGKICKHLPLLDHLEKLGYNRIKFQHARWDDLVYHREDQIVARELLVITVKE